MYAISPLAYNVNQILFMCPILRLIKSPIIKPSDLDPSITLDSLENFRFRENNLYFEDEIEGFDEKRILS